METSGAIVATTHEEKEKEMGKKEENNGSAAVSERHSFFLDPECMEQYREHQKSHFDLNLMITLFVLCSAFFFLRCNFFHFLNDGRLFILSFTSTFCAFFLYLIFLAAYIKKSSETDTSRGQSHWASFILDSRWLRDSLADAIAIFGSFGISVGLYARILNGQCPQNVNIWDSQRCNPFSSSSSLPSDHVVFVCILPILSQTVINGMTFRCCVLCWLFSATTVIMSVIEVNGRLEAFTLLTSMIVLALVYRNENLMRLTFSQKRQTALAEKDKRRCVLLQQQAEHQLLTEKNSYAMEILAMKAEEECKLKEMERTQMVALLGNVAHDLKTPLQSFLMDLESLRESLLISPSKPTQTPII